MDDAASPPDVADVADVPAAAPADYAGGPSFTASRRVRWGDAEPRGRIRLDGVARFLQDVSNDDTRAAGDDPTSPWVVRRTTIDVARPPRVGEVVDMTTFCGGIGSRWADRRTSIRGEHGGHVEAASLWVHVDRHTGRPARLPAAFLERYAEFDGDRKVGARLRHGPVPPGVDRRPWPLRSTDLDGMGHVNNAATWEPVEDELARRGLRPRWAEIEYGDGLEPADEVELASLVASDGSLRMWLTVEGSVRATAVVHPRS